MQKEAALAAEQAAEIAAREAKRLARIEAQKTKAAIEIDAAKRSIENTSSVAGSVAASARRRLSVSVLGSAHPLGPPVLTNVVGLTEEKSYLRAPLPVDFETKFGSDASEELSQARPTPKPFSVSVEQV